MSRAPRHSVVDQDPRFAIQIVNADSGRIANQMDAAHEYIHEKTRGLFNKNKITGLFKSIWYSNIARDIVQHQEFRRVTKEVVQNEGNYLKLKGGSQAEFGQEMAAVVDRFADSVNNPFHLDPNETNVQMDALLREKLTYAITQYAAINSTDPKVGKEAFDRQVKQFIHEYNTHSPRMVSYGHNAFEVAKNARQARMHGEDMARIENAITGHYGVARAGVRTQHQREILDVAADNPLINHRLPHGARRVGEAVNRNGLSLINEATAGTALIVGLSAARVAVKGSMGTLNTALAFAGVGALWAGTRTWREKGRRRQDFLRAAGAGGTTTNPEDMPVTDKLRRTQYNAMHASKLIDDLGAILNDINGADQETIDNAVGTIAEVVARRQISNELHIDLIEYSNEKQIEQERRVLYSRLDQAIEAVQRAIDNGHPAAPVTVYTGPGAAVPTLHARWTRGRRRLQQEAETIGMMPPGGVFGTLVETRMHQPGAGGGPSLWEQLINNINGQERLFYTQRRNQTLGIMAIAGVTGATIGLGVGELMNATGAEHIVTGRLHEQLVPPGGGHHNATAVGLSDHMRLNYHPYYHSQLIDNGNLVAGHPHHPYINWDRQGNMADLVKGNTHDRVRQALTDHHELVRQGWHHYKDMFGADQMRLRTEIWSPLDYHWVHQYAGALPLYYLKPHEKLKKGAKNERLPSSRLSIDTLSKSYLYSFDRATGEKIDDLADKLRRQEKWQFKPKIAERPKAVIMIPVDAGHDNSLYSQLLGYARQVGLNDIDKDLEVVIVINKPNNNPVPLMDQINRFRRGLVRQNINAAHPEADKMKRLRVRVVEQVYNPGERTSQNFQEIITASVISDLKRRGMNLDQVALIMNGARHQNINKNYVATVLKELDRSPRLDILVGQTGPIPPGALDPARNPDFDPRARRVRRILERFATVPPGSIGISRANIAFRPRAYMTPDRHRIDFGYFEYSTEVGGMIT